MLSRRYYRIGLKLETPLSISSGESIETDSDVLKDNVGHYFIPGTSFAGAFRNYLENCKIKTKDVFGDNKNDGDNSQVSHMSSLYISDMLIDNPKITIRDRIMINDIGKDISVEKVAKDKAKMNMQIIETGATGVLYMNFVKRENDKFDIDEIVKFILMGIDNGDIRLGSAKNRGFGRLSVSHEDCNYVEFNEENVNDYLDFKKNIHNKKKYNKKIEYTPESLDEIFIDDKNHQYIYINMPLKLEGSICIRQYNTESDAPDYRHITCDGKPVIPGTSWCGAIRGDAVNILVNLGIDRSKALRKVFEWFGGINENDIEKKNDLHQSRVIVSESIIEGANEIITTRNAINRFSFATKSRSLYSEKIFNGGTTMLNIMIRKEGDYEALLAVIKLIIDDIRKGYLAVGGLTSIGRGIFSGEELILGNSKQEVINALNNLVNQED